MTAESDKWEGAFGIDKPSMKMLYGKLEFCVDFKEFTWKLLWSPGGEQGKLEEDETDKTRKLKLLTYGFFFFKTKKVLEFKY